MKYLVIAWIAWPVELSYLSVRFKNCYSMNGNYYTVNIYASTWCLKMQKCIECRGNSPPPTLLYLFLKSDSWNL